jgi:hypothetical protein
LLFPNNLPASRTSKKKSVLDDIKNMGDLLERLVRAERSTAINRLSDPRGVMCRLTRKTQIELARIEGSYDTDSELIESVNQDFYDLEQPFDEDTIERVKEELEPYILDEDISDVEKRDGEQIYNVIGSEDINIREESEGVAQILDNKELEEALHSFFGSEFDITWICGIYYSKDFHSVPEEWHIDNYGARRTSTIRLFIFLSDESSGDGPIQIISPEESREVISKYGMEKIEENPSIVEEEANIKEFSGPPGSAILFTPGHQLHRAVHPDEKEHRRKVLTVNIEPKLAKL